MSFVEALFRVLAGSPTPDLAGMQPRGRKLLANRAILDIETLGLFRGAGIHEMAIYEPKIGELTEYILNPNMVYTTSAVAGQDVTRLVSSPLDKHQAYRPSFWRDVITAQVSMDIGKQESWEAVRRNLTWQNPFLARALEEGKHPHLLDESENPVETNRRRAAFEQKGVRNFVSQRAAIEDVLRPGGALQRQLRGKTIWIANVAFESKQIGAQLAALEEADAAVKFKSMLETYNPEISDPLYVTGREVNIARTMAQLSGDWTQVWRAYLANPPKAGETAVRDIQDVIRAMMSYGRKLGLAKHENTYFGTSIDVAARLFGSLEKEPQLARKLLLSPEVHRAAEDVVLEDFVLNKAAKYTSVLQEVVEGTPLGFHYQELARHGKGPLIEAATYFKRLDILGSTGESGLDPVIKEINLIKRLARAQEDLFREGVTYQTGGYETVYQMRQLTPTGEEVMVPRPIPARRAFRDMREVVKFLQEQGIYELDVEDVYQRMQAYLAEHGDTLESINRFVDKMTSERVGTFIEQNQDLILETRVRRLGTLVSRWGGVGISAKKHMLDMFSEITPVKWGKGALAVAGMLTAAGFTWSMATGSKQRPQPPSILAYNYAEWEKYNGLQDQGVAARTRRRFTDFASPYRGPVVSNYVFLDQELQAEREKWLREQYGAVHNDPIKGLFGIFGPFKDLNLFGRRGYRYINTGHPVSSQNYTGLRGDNLMAINLSSGNWKVGVEDADTIVVKKGGIRGAIASMFGMNRGYTFRLAGVDAPELSHGPTSYHTPQPYAEAAAEALRNIIKGSKNLELVYDPTNTTYGRMMGAVIADGKNINFEVVRRGLAAYLPYGKYEESMIDYAVLANIEKRAHAAARGLWGEPWAQAFYEFSAAAGDRVTFNTLAKKEKIVERMAVASNLVLMEQAQAQGMLSTADRIAAADLGHQYRNTPDQVGPAYFQAAPAPYGGHLHEMQQEMADFMRTKGTGNYGFKYSRRSGYGSLDAYMALDSLYTTNSIWNRRRPAIYQTYGFDRMRKQRMAASQRQVNQTMFNSPIGHYSM